MNWYKKIIESQGTDEWTADQNRRMPEDIREIYEYYRGEDEPIDRQRSWMRRNERANSLAVENNRRHNMYKKVSIHEEDIKRLKKQLEEVKQQIGKSNSLDLYEEEKQIKNQISAYQNIISRILSKVPKHYKRRERFI